MELLEWEFPEDDYQEKITIPKNISIFGAGFSKNKLVNSVYFKTSTGIMPGTVLESYDSRGRTNKGSNILA